MGKYFDFVILSFVSFGLTFAWLKYFGIATQTAFKIAGIGTIGIIILLAGLIFIIKRKRKISIDEMFFALSAVGAKDGFDLFVGSLPQDKIVLQDFPFLVIKDYTCEKVLFYNIKFSTTSQDEIANAYRFVKDKGCCEVTIISRSVPKIARQTATRLGLKIDVLSPKRIRDYVVKHNLLKNKLKISGKKYTFSSIKELFLAITEPARIKYYLLSSVALLLSSLLVSFKIYYVISACIACLLCLVACIRKIGEG